MAYYSISWYVFNLGRQFCRFAENRSECARACACLCRGYLVCMRYKHPLYYGRFLAERSFSEVLFFLGFLLGESGYVHGLADSMPTPSVEISQHMQPLYPSFCFGEHGFQNTSMRKKALAMKRFEAAQLHDSACAAKFDGEV